MKNIRTLTRIGVGGIALVALASAGFADTGPTITPAPAAPATSPAATSKSETSNTGKDTVVLDKFEVKEVPEDQQIMPTTRPITSVFGDSRSIIDTPRSVTSINKALMDQVRIKSFLDLQQFASGVQSAQRYGTAATPSIRGDLAAVYYNGQQSKYTYNDVPVSFNGVEALDIVKGAGGAVYGPQSYGSAGYVNMVTKQPYFDKQHTELSLTYGGVNNGEGYSNVEYSVDNSGPINDKAAYRVSYLGRSGDGFYLDTKDETQDIFTALTYNFSDSLSATLWVQYYHTRFNDISGINKVTQALIDDSVYSFDGIHKVSINANNVLSGKDDYGIANRFQTQLILNKAFSPDISLKNSTSFEDRNSEKYNPSTSYS